MENEEIEAKGISYSNIKFTLIEISNFYYMFPQISRHTNALNNTKLAIIPCYTVRVSRQLLHTLSSDIPSISQAA